MTIEAWLQAAMADAKKRGLPELESLIESLAQSTRALRRADFNDDAHGPAVGAELAPPHRPKV